MLTKAMTVAVTGLVLAVVTGCGRQVAIEPPPDPPPICGDLIENLPDSVDGSGRRPTSPDSSATAAWGEPPIVLRCGVPRPDALDSTAVLFDVDGIPWFPEDLQAGIVFTTIIPAGLPVGPDPSTIPDTDDSTSDDLTSGYAYVEVIVPAAYPSPGSVLADLTPALAQSNAAS